MAKSNALKIKSKSAQSVEEVDDQDAVEINDEQEVIETDTTGDEKDRLLNDLVHFSCFEELRPAPTVGVISLVRDMGMSVLPKGVSKIPRVIAEVLADKKLGQVIKL